MSTNDEHREKPDKRLTPIDLYKLTPKTNCRECGFASCFAFSTQVITGQASIEVCPHLEGKQFQEFMSLLADQPEEGIGLKREGFEKALQFLRQEILKWDFRSIADSLGAKHFEADGKPALELIYFGREVVLTAGEIRGCDSAEALDSYEKILLYNYVIGGAVEPAGVWIGMESLPNSVSKIQSLKAHCQEPLAKKSAGEIHRLPSAIAGIGKEVSLPGAKADFAAEFQVLPKLAVRILWWDEDEREGFQAETKFLFDSKVLGVLDLESLLFTCEQITDRILERLPS
ncbi:MAG TPA: DUF3786 domain-containing protein [Syntrophobacteraceae bacterium]|nr:DUF3786 domain-containing protein [Syntrophobacteraceae bacterium]